ncbi:hypothetical protein [Ferrovibrio sp.]|uniref:hypothetical protein n=1 Tax=Ferrovibrio sp. TaxID=1917215 RepID=UPI003D1329EE
MVDGAGSTQTSASKLGTASKLPTFKSGNAAQNTQPQDNPVLAAGRAALEKLRQPRERSEAETKLEEVLQAMKRASKSSRLDAARRKLEQLKARLKALEMAAASAAARGDAKAAKAIAREVKQLARDLAGALREAGQGGGVVAAPQVAKENDNKDAAEKAGTLAEGRPETAADQAGAMIKAALNEAAGDPSAQTAKEAQAERQALDSLKAEARGVMKQLKKLLEKARLALFNPLADKKEAGKAEKAFNEAEQALADLNAASLPSGGAGLDLGGADLGGMGVDVKA